MDGDPAVRLAALVAACKDLMTALRHVRALGLGSWCIGAGTIRALVWDTLHGVTPDLARQDVDVAYFDPAASPEQDVELEDRLRSVMPGLRWEVTNQAGVHRWFAEALGQVVPPLRSLEQGVGTWPETATCVGVFLNEDGAVGVIAPLGLDDLFALRVRHNPGRASLAVYRDRVRKKRFDARWPRLDIHDLAA